MIGFFYTFYRLLRGMGAALRNPEFEVLLFLAGVTLAAGTVFYHNVEQWGWLDSLYFSVTTLATVGFGDLTPHTSLGKIFTIAYIFVGVGVLLGFLTEIGKHTIAQSKDGGLLPWRNKNSSS